MSDAGASDAELLDPIVSRYKSEGFEVFIQPSRVILPAFFGGCRPDAIAIGPDRKIAIEIVRSNARSSDKIGRLRALLSAHPDWELFVLYVSPSTSTEKMERASAAAIKAAMRQVMELRDDGRLAAALIVGWSALEAIARVLLPDRLARPQPAASLLEVLASEGYLTPSEADLLRPAVTARNAVAHGQLEAKIEPVYLDALTSALHTLIAFMPKNAA